MPRSNRPNVSAGLLLFRRPVGRLEVFIAHPGGPFWRDRDVGAWTIPKGIVEAGEDLLDAARREFVEETSIQPNPPFIPLGSIRQKGDADPLSIVSNRMRTEWPRGSGRMIEFPEVDRCAWFDAPTAKSKMNPAQAELVDRLEAALVPKDAGS